MKKIIKKYPPHFKNFVPSISVASPGRINLIGEHTDYNNGFVLPTAIDKKIFLELSENGTDQSCNVYSYDVQDTLSFEIDQLAVSQTSWHNYILGVVAEIKKTGRKLKGFDCVIRSTIPFGAGISSSAALEAGLASGLNALFELQLQKEEIVELSMYAEHHYVGSKCGIMDQFASVMSRKDHLIFLDCRSLQAEYISADFKNCKLLLLNTNVSHNLASSEYNTRRNQCEEAVRLISDIYPKVNSLRDVSLTMLQELRSEFSEELFSRASYVIEENLRVKAAVDAIQKRELREFGQLMYRSHEGLSKKYEVSCKELDFLVNFSKTYDYIYGARMMGGGFGGCTINLIEADKIDSFVKEASEAYSREFNISLEAIAVSPSEGTTVTKTEN